MSTSIKRNMLEFAFENHDWRQVTEEENFFVCRTTGTRIHPVHGIRMIMRFRSQYFSQLQSASKQSFVQFSNMTALRNKAHPSIHFSTLA